MTFLASFDGRDLRFTWDLVTSPDDEITETVFKDFELQIFVGDNLMRREYLSANFYVYTFAQQVMDQGPVPSRTVKVKLRSRDTFLRYSDWQEVEWTNTRPGECEFTLTPIVGGIEVVIEPQGDDDIKGYLVYRETVSPTTPGESTVVYQGVSNLFVDNNVVPGVEYFYNVAAYDVYDDGIDDVVISPTLSAIPLTSNVVLKSYSFTGITFSTSGNTLSWTAGTAVKTQGGVVTTDAISADSVVWTVGEIFVYYDESTGEFETTDDLLIALGTERRQVVATYRGGSDVVEGLNEPIIDGNRILTGTIGANQLVTGSAVITGTAQIAGAVIQSANIGDLQVERIKIANGAVSDSAAFSVFPDGGIVMDQISDGFDFDVKLNVNLNTYESVAYGNGRFVAVSSSGVGSRVMMTLSDTIAWKQYRTPVDNNWKSVAFGNGLFVAVAESGTNSRVMTSYDGITWTVRTSPSDNNNWQSVTYGNGVFVAVANTGTGNRVMTSPDGITWTARTSAADNNWLSVTYGEPSGSPLFVAVSTTGTGNRVMTSPNGVTWTIRTSAADSEWNSVTWGNGVFVAVAATGDHTLGERVMTSPDGVTWTKRVSTGRNWRGVAYGTPGGTPTFVAVASSGTNNRVITSTDNGVTWTERVTADLIYRGVAYGDGVFVTVSNTTAFNILKCMTSPDGITWDNAITPFPLDHSKITYANGIFVNVGFGPSNADESFQIRTSTDGINWTIRATPLGVWRDVAYGGGVWVAVGSGGDNRMMTSTDNGVTWNAVTSVTQLLHSVTYGAGLFVAVGYFLGGSAYIITSPDGVTWTSRTSPSATSQWQSVTYGNGVFVAVTNTGTASERVMTSTDGITWSNQTAPNTNDWYAVTYGEPSGSPLFVATAWTGVGNRVMTSPDGVTWTSRTSAADNDWSDVTWGNGLFVAVSDSGSTNRVMTSPDGVTWTIRTTPQQNYQGVAYGAGRFVACAYTSTVNPVDDDLLMTSTDGITWTASRLLEDRVINDWRGVAYGNGVFVAVSRTGDNRIMTSIDGRNWTLRAAPQANEWSSVTWGAGLFVAVAQTGTNRVMTSPDGVTWTLRTAAAAVSWWDVTFGEPNGNPLFVAVAYTGTAAQMVMTSPDGITWTSRTASAVNQWLSVTWANSLFVAVANSGTNRVMTSPDGVTWTGRTPPAQQWRSITYGNGLFVAVADSGTGNRVMTSRDAVTWTSRTTPADNAWRAVAFGEGYFVAVSNTGDGNRSMISLDGKTWTLRNTPVNVPFEAIGYGGGTFVAVGDGTTTPGSKVMYSVSTLGDFYDFPNERVLYYTDVEPNTIERLIIEPGLYGASTTLQVNNPTSTDNVVCRFSTGVAVYKYADYTLTGDPVLIAQRGQKTLECEWNNTYLQRSIGADDVESFVSPIILNKGVDFEPGEVISVVLTYASYSSNPAIASIKRSTPGFGFQWTAFWK